MKNRILMATLPVLACFALLPGAQAVCNEGCGSNFNTFEGEDALINTTGSGNTAFGWKSLTFDTDGSFNTGVGAGTLVLNNGGSNTAVGAGALLLNTTGVENIAIGTDALVFNSIASNNNAVGTFALFNNDSSGNGLANFNNAHGRNALFANVDGSQNNAFGDLAMESNTSGSFNSAFGDDALLSVTTGSSNTAVGDEAGSNLIDGEGNIYIGAQVQAVGTGEFEFIRIGNDTAFTFPYDTYIAGIYGRPVGPSPLTVMCGSDGKLSANASSRRFKHDIKPMVNASEAILALKPVSFRYNNDSTDTPWFGLIAEDVAAVNPDLIVRDKEGKPFGVRYDAVNAMLLNEFIKEHKKVEEQQASIGQLKSEMQTMVAQLKEQAAQIQKVSAQLEMSKPAPQIVVNKP
jgi:trimeric autotransporter adhesin